MAANKKPRRRYKQRPVHQPMMRATHDNVALEMRLAVEALIGAPSPETYNQLSKMLRVMADVGTTAPALGEANAAMLEICDRFDRVGKVGVSAAEAERLRCAIDGLDAAVARVPANVFLAAVAGVSAMCEEMGI